MTTSLVRIQSGGAAYRLLTAGKWAALAALVVALPYLLPTFRLSQVTGALILALAVVGLNLLTGFGGQISLGHSAFFGIGAYTTGSLSINHGVSVPVTLVIGMALCFVVGVVVGLPALRLRGTYLALVTLALGVLLPSVIRRLDGLTGGSSGLFGIRFEPPAIAYFAGAAGRNVWLYYVVVTCLALGCLVVFNLTRGRVGMAVVALRDDEAAAAVVGINRAAVRTTLFGCSAAVTGLAGSLFAVHAGVLIPEMVSLVLTLNLLIALILGGRASHWGPVVGGLIIYFVPVWTSDLSEGPISGVLFGLLCIAMVFVLPDGIVGGLRRASHRLVAIEPRLPVSARPPSDPAVDKHVNGSAHQSPIGGSATRS